MFERRSEPLATPSEFRHRMLIYGGIAAMMILTSLGIGVLGYHLFESLSWVDSLLNASMILGGMGPVDTLHTVTGKIFASLYALFSGIILLASVGVLFTPIFHRILHRFHLEIEGE